MKRLPTLMIALLGLILGTSFAVAAEEAEQAAQEPAAATTPAGHRFPGLDARVARQQALNAQRQAAHEARVQAMLEESDRFRELAGNQGMFMDPWARQMIANQELQRRLMDPYGTSMIDRLEEDFWNRTAAYGDRPDLMDPTRDIQQWARQQQQAIYDQSRRAQQNLAKAVAEGKVTYAPVVPWVTPYGYGPYGWGAPYGYGAPFFW